MHTQRGDAKRLMLQLLLRGAYLVRTFVWSITRPVTFGVRMLLVQGKQVVLIEHSYQPGWYLPGGGLKRREILEHGARREAVEETGACLGDVHLFGVYTNVQHQRSDHIVVFYCTDFSLSGKPDQEIKRVTLFDLDHLPEAVSPGTQRRIEEWTGWDGIPKVGTW